MQRLASVASWKSVLASAPPGSHILQIYDSDPFVESAVAHFAAEGIGNGEAVLLSGTKPHLAGIDRELRSLGVDVHSPQLVREGVEEALSRPAWTVEELIADRPLKGVRWWGELTNTLCQRGDHAAGMAAERKANTTARNHDVTIFCSYLSDKYDPRAYDSTLLNLCSLHSHVIPAQDYVLHRQAVNRAISHVVGDIKGTLLQSLHSWKGLGCDLPSSQALLFWLQETLPEKFDSVLKHARAYQEKISRPEVGT